MRHLFIFLVCLFCTTTEVLASVKAGAYEALYLFYAYRMEWEQNKGGNHRTDMVPNRCSGGTAPCNFDGFVREVYGIRPGNPGNYRLGSGFNPRNYANIDDAADALANRYGFTGVHFNEQRLHRAFRGGRGARSPGYTTVMTRAARTIQDARGAGVTMYLDECRTSLLGVIDARKSDSAVHTWPTIQASFRAAGLPGNPTLEATRENTPAGGGYDDYNSIDTERNIARAEGLGHENNPAASPAVQRWQGVVAQIRNNPNVRSHIRIYTNLEQRLRAIRRNNLNVC
ncbi:hypothetical protein B0T14DRAFT_565096 [Immersiella caudata]|uniref:Uncharacterized protein n=1 Tax=Immersiella caudata TaxID=314043 RepID=A0AA39WYP0_9PEZI|nr:hypothetical protein B0T14DRAFT_565096 [Immersiella caudata]